MATGVKPRDEDSLLTRSDLETIKDAMKNKKFRDLLSEYCEEVRDPANQALYQKEMTQLEKERGYDVTFINPKGGYVIKTSVAGDRKAFINICSNDNVGKPSYKVQEMDGKRGMSWQIPYSITPPREEYDNKKQRCVIYDVVFHPDTLRMAEVNKQFREIVNNTAFDGLQKTYNIHLDNNNVRFPKSYYKGMSTPAVIRKEDPNYKPPEDEDSENISPEIMEKLYPQHIYGEEKTPSMEEQPKQMPTCPTKRKARNTEFQHATEKGYTIPKYVIKQQKNVDLQEYTYHKDSKQYTAIPSQIVVEVNLPLLSSTKDCVLDVQEKVLSLISEKPAKYKLDLTLPYAVNDECGSAKFDKTKHKLIVTLPVIRNSVSSDTNSLKVDSGVESEENSGSQSDEDHPNLIVEWSSKPNEAPSFTANEYHSHSKHSEEFLEPSYGYMLPSYTYNILDDIIAFTFHVKNTEPDSVKVRKEDNKILIKFTTVGSGFVPVHYAATILFEDSVKFDNATGEAWDNNVILQLELAGEVPQQFRIGVREASMTTEYLNVSQTKKVTKTLEKIPEKPLEEALAPVVEVTNLGSETNIVVSSTHMDEDDDDDFESPTSQDREIVWTDSGMNENGAKSILRKPNVMRSYSESSMGDVASSMDYISSDCIPEESSYKKTVRFNDVIAKQFYRYNSSIEGQKKKNQRKKSKKRTQDRRRSESEAEDEVGNTSMSSKPRLKSVLKQRRDSGLADTSDAEDKNSHSDSSQCNNGNMEFNSDDEETSNSVFNIVESKDNGKVKEEPALWKSKTSETTEKSVKVNSEALTSENIIHNTQLYDPDRLNKGQYLEVAFKNDLIFDLDM